MINEFKQTETRDSGVIHKGVFEQIKMLHAQNPQQAGELAISAIELILTGSISSDDFLIDLALKSYAPVVEKSRERYEKKVEVNKQAQIEKLNLAEIAEMLNNGATQKLIADTLGEPLTTINYRVKKLRDEFPELLNKNTKNTKNTKLDTDTDTDNDNDNEKMISRSPSVLGVVPPNPHKEFVF